MTSLGLSVLYILLPPSVHPISMRPAFGTKRKTVTFLLASYVQISALGLPILSTTIAGDEELAVQVIFDVELTHHFLLARRLSPPVMGGEVGGGELLATVVTMVAG